MLYYLDLNFPLVVIHFRTENLKHHKLQSETKINGQY